MTKPLPSEDEIIDLHRRAQDGDIDAIQEYADLLDRCAAALLSKPARPRRPHIVFPPKGTQNERENAA